MGAYVQGVYVPILGEVDWDDEVNDFLTRSGESVVNVKAAPYGAVGDDSADDTASISAAITAAGGGTILFPPGVYKISSTLTPAENSVWIGAGARSWDYPTGGTVLHFTGTSTPAIQFGPDIANIRMRDFQIYCSSDTAGVSALKFVDPAGNCHLSNIVLKGPGTSNARAVLFTGGAGCTCHNVFDTVYIRNWSEGLRMSGVANSNVFSNCSFATCLYAIRSAKVGADTFAGSDNLFLRCELDGGITTGITLADSSSRNCFVKCTLDGTYTTDLQITGGSEDNSFLNCHFATTGIIDDTSATSTYIGCTGVVNPFQMTFHEAVLGFPDGSTLYERGADTLATESVVQNRQGTATNDALQFITFSDSSSRWICRVDGKMFWGPGSGGTDTDLYRDAAGVLRTGSQVVAVDKGVSTMAKNGTPVDGDVNSARDGTIILDTSTNRLYIRSNGVWKYAALT